MQTLQRLKNFLGAKLKKLKGPKNPFSKQTDLDKQLVYSLKKKGKIPSFKQLKHLPKVLSPKEYFLIKLLGVIILFCLIFIGTDWYWKNVQFVPRDGGEFIEGEVGSPIYINPLLAQTNEVDLDISNLVFSGLMKFDKTGQLIPDLASSYEISPDQTTYVFHIKENVLWHDGEKLTADDIIFTVKNAQDPQFKSPLLYSLKGIKIEKVDDNTIKFTLKTPYTPFLSILTFGILPSHLWSNIPPENSRLVEYNLKPIGSGPWQFKSLTKDKQGNIKSYTLEKNKNNYGSKPYLNEITFKFYAETEEVIQAALNKQIQGISFTPKEYLDKVTKNKNLVVHSLRLPQYTAVFFNKRNNILLKNKTIRESLAYSIDKERILKEVLKQEGDIIYGPILPGYSGYHPDIKKYELDFAKANQLLDNDGWKKLTPAEYLEVEKALQDKQKEEAAKNQPASNTPIATTAPAAAVTAEQIIEVDPGQEFFRQKKDSILKITLTTVDQPEYVKAAEIIKENWQKIGFKVKLNIIDGEKMQQEIIKPRAYDALLYGEIVGSDPDPYPFWHSSQADDPGLNLALFFDPDADKLIIEARKTTDLSAREKKYIEFQNILAQDIPAIFLYNPTYTYIIDKNIKGFDLTQIILPSDRFNNLDQWYVKTRRRLW